LGEPPTIGDGIAQKHDAARIGCQGFHALVVLMIAAELIPVLKLVGKTMRETRQAAVGLGRIELVHQLAPAGRRQQQ
jgi:hypothetical protein